MLIAERSDGRALGPKEKKAFGLLSRALPYLFLFLASFLPFASFLKTGLMLPGGDDSLWHQIWPFDLALGFQNGFFGINSPSHTLMGNLGLGTYLFYGPLSHYFVAILHSVFPFITINVALKVLAIGSTFLGGIWTYLLAKKICKDDLCSLMLGFCFIFMPYRLNCFLYRAAYPEATAIAFFPLLFLGLQGIVEKEFTPKNFTLCILGVSCLVLTHPFTALVGILTGIVYLLVSYRWIVPFFKDRNALIYGGVSVFLVFCLIGWYFFPMVSYKSSGLYSVSDPIIMWTNADHLANDVVRSNVFSGFLRPYWIDHMVPEYGFPNPGRESWASWVGDYISFGFFGALGIALMEFLSRRKFVFQGAAIGAFVSLLSLLFSSREECFLALPLFAASLLLIGFSEENRREKEEMLGIAKEEAKRPEFYWALAAFAFCFVLLYVGPVWRIMPEIFLSAQFPWRIWGLCLFLAILLLAYFIKPISSYRLTRSSLAFVSIFCFLSCMGPIDKRFATQVGGVRGEPTIETIQRQKRMGVQNEYVPLIYQKNAKYQSEYENSLYPVIFRELNYSGYSYQFTMEDYHDPVFLEGEGDLRIVALNSPEAAFEAEILSDEALVQLPQFYYDGYLMQWKNTLEEGRYGSCEGENVDGLVSFRLPKGTYVLSLRWVGTTSYQVFSPLLPVGLCGIVALNAIPWAIKTIAKRKESAKEEGA